MARDRLRHFGGPSGVLFVARAAALGAGVATVLIASYHLGAEGRGQVATFAVTQLIGSAILGFGTGSGGYVVAQRRQLSPPAICGVLVGWAVVIAFLIAGAVALVGLVRAIVPATPGIDGLAGALLVFGIPGQFLAAGLTGLAMGTGRVGTTAAGYSAAPITALVGTTVATLGGAPVEAYLAVHAASYVLAAVVMLAAIGTAVWPTRGMVRLVLRVSRAAAVGDISNALSYRFDVLVLGAIAGADAVGVYSLAVQALEPIWLIATAASSGLLITLAGSPVETWAERVRAVTRRVVLATFGGVSLVLLVFPGVVGLVGPTFALSPATAILLAPGVVALAGSKVLAAGQTAAGRLWLGSVIATAAVVVTTLLDLIIIPKLGPLGASVASSAGYGSSLAMWILVTRHFGSRPELAPALRGVR